MQSWFSETVFGVPWSALAAVAVAIAVVFVIVDTGVGAEGWRWFVLRWFHPLCWLMLALAALARSRATPIPAEWATGLAAAGGLVYLAFMLTMFTRSA